jgi:hypothetical protein
MAIRPVYGTSSPIAIIFSRILRAKEILNGG